jgi:hypothetical protein
MRNEKKTHSAWMSVFHSSFIIPYSSFLYPVPPSRIKIAIAPPAGSEGGDGLRDAPRREEADSARALEIRE